MSRKRETIWEKQASRRMIFICFLLIVATFICFGGTYLQFKANMSTPQEEEQVIDTRGSSIDELTNSEEEVEQ